MNDAVERLQLKMVFWVGEMGQPELRDFSLLMSAPQTAPVGSW